MTIESTKNAIKNAVAGGNLNYTNGIPTTSGLNDLIEALVDGLYNTTGGTTTSAEPSYVELLFASIKPSTETDEGTFTIDGVDYDWLKYIFNSVTYHRILQFNSDEDLIRDEFRKNVDTSEASPSLGDLVAKNYQAQ